MTLPGEAGLIETTVIDKDSSSDQTPGIVSWATETHTCSPDAIWKFKWRKEHTRASPAWRWGIKTLVTWVDYKAITSGLKETHLCELGSAQNPLGSSAAVLSSSRILWGLAPCQLRLCSLQPQSGSLSAVSTIHIFQFRWGCSLSYTLRAEDFI